MSMLFFPIDWTIVGLAYLRVTFKISSKP